MASKGHNQPSRSLAAIISEYLVNRTTQAGYSSQQTTQSVTVSPLPLIRDPRSSQPVTLNPAAVNKTLQALVKAQRSNPVPLQLKQQAPQAGVQVSSLPHSSKEASKPIADDLEC